jgi:hypothetical protein
VELKAIIVMVDIILVKVATSIIIWATKFIIINYFNLNILIIIECQLYQFDSIIMVDCSYIVGEYFNFNIFKEQFVRVIVKDFKLFVEELEFMLITNCKVIKYSELLAIYIILVIIMNFVDNFILNNYLIFVSKFHY